jgi:digeranylgeranylglycerophospholipid reductase
MADTEEALFLAPSERYGDGGGWFYPSASGDVSFGYAVLSPHPTYPAERLKAAYECALQEFEPYATWLREASPQEVEMGSIPIYPPKRFVYDGLLLVGDAAGQATIWSCMGTEPALVNGHLAGLAAVHAHDRRDFSAAVLNSYQQTWEETNGQIYRQGARLGNMVWRQDGAIWNEQIPRIQQLTPPQMAARLRTNWPLLPSWQVSALRLYDLAGRMRRRIASALVHR